MFGILKYIKQKVVATVNWLSQPINLIQLGTTALITAFSFYPAFKAQKLLRKDTAYALARGAGATLKYIIPVIFIPTLRMSHAFVQRHIEKLQQIPLIGGLFYNRMGFHKMLGWTFIGASILHTGAHLYRHSVALIAQESATGVAMLCAMGIPIISMYLIRRFKWSITDCLNNRSYYTQFLLPHQFGWWVLLTAFSVHTQDFRLMSFGAAVLGAFGVDRVWEWIQSSNVKVKNIEYIHDNMIVIETQKPDGFEYKTGQKVYFAYPWWSAFFNALHPFTLASSPDENLLRFVISGSGKWTSKLILNLGLGDKIRITPAFPSLLDSSNNQNEDEVEDLLISSGSGMAMTIAHLNDMSSNKPISIIHSTRNREELGLLNRFAKKSPRFNGANYYLTSNQSNYHYRAPGHFKGVSTENNRFDPSNSKRLNRFEDGSVYFCGNEKICKSLEESLRDRPDVKLYKEKYNF